MQSQLLQSDAKAPQYRSTQATEMSRAEMEARRFDAVADLKRGVKQSRIAVKYGVSRTTASRWARMFASGGQEELRRRRAPGRPRRLSPDKEAVLRDIFHAGPRNEGLAANGWTAQLFGDVIFRRFGVSYQEDHVGRIITRLGLRQPRQYRRRFDEAV